MGSTCQVKSTQSLTSDHQLTKRMITSILIQRLKETRIHLLNFFEDLEWLYEEMYLAMWTTVIRNLNKYIFYKDKGACWRLLTGGQSCNLKKYI